MSTRIVARSNDQSWLLDAVVGLVAIVASQLAVRRVQVGGGTAGLDVAIGVVAAAGLLWLGLRSFDRLMQAWRHAPKRPLRMMLADDSGVASVAFVMTFPIFLMVVAMIVQLALLANAALVVHHAAFISARSAIVSLPAGDERAPRRAAAMVLSGVSPKGRGPGYATSEGRYIHRTLRRAGVSVVPSLPQRYSYALAATRVRFDGKPGSSSAARDVQTRLTYDFKLTVPGAAAILQPRRSSVGGVAGRFVTIEADRALRASPGRNNGSGMFGSFGSLVADVTRDREIGFGDGTGSGLGSGLAGGYVPDGSLSSSRPATSVGGQLASSLPTGQGTEAASTPAQLSNFESREEFLEWYGENVTLYTDPESLPLARGGWFDRTIDWIGDRLGGFEDKIFVGPGKDGVGGADLMPGDPGAGVAASIALGEKGNLAVLDRDNSAALVHDKLLRLSGQNFWNFSHPEVRAAHQYLADHAESKLLKEVFGTLASWGEEQQPREPNRYGSVWEYLGSDEYRLALAETAGAQDGRSSGGSPR